MSKQSAGKKISFPRGIPGFENYKVFELVEEENTPLAQLNSVEDKEVGFVLFRPQIVFPTYLTKVELNTEEAELLELREENSVDVWVILTLCLSDMAKTTANLRAPIIINPKSAKGIQIILSDEQFSSRQPLFVSPENNGNEKNSREGAVG